MLVTKRAFFVFLVVLAAIGCGSPPAQAPTAIATQSIFDKVSPSVVAILNDDQATREAEDKQAMKEMGVESHAPKTIVDVSLRKEPMPHGTGFLIEGGIVVTAAHVVLAPEQLKITTRGGQTVAAELLYIDEVRDVALLKPAAKLEGVPPIKIAEKNPEPGHRVWALGHTGAGLWALSWGISEGITSGVVDLLGAKLLLFDAAVYPGFSGGPVITLDEHKNPEVVGVNHAILFTGAAVASISSASAASDIRDTIARKPAPIQAKLAEFARTRGSEMRAQMFITTDLSVHKDAQMLTTAAIVGNDRTIDPGEDDIARIPVVAMLFGLSKGDHDVTFELQDPDDATLMTIQKKVKVGDHERVTFATADFRFEAKSSGHYGVAAKVEGKMTGKASVWVEDPESDEEAVDDEDTDDTQGEPRVDVVVASFASDNPFALGGIRAGWIEWRYPRRVGFTWYAHGSRGWSGTNVAISAFVLDENGVIVGRGVGCIRPELRPEHAWSCAGQGGTPLLKNQGRYDVVFTLNERPIAVWPMEALVKTNESGSALEKWMQGLRKHKTMKKRTKIMTSPPTPATPAPAPTPATKPGAKPPATKAPAK